MKQVEQVTKDGRVVYDYDTSLSGREIKGKLEELFTVERLETGLYIPKIDITLLVKNITYLGHPHPEYKKRIQIPSKWNAVLADAHTVLLGIYTYKENTIYCIFDKKKRGKSSSAHVSILDLQKAIEYGRFEKTDAFGNKIITCTPQQLHATLVDIQKGLKYMPKEMLAIDVFAKTLPLHWQGIPVYKEMLAAPFSQGLQGEWPGFYFEYLFEKFLKETPRYQKVCAYLRNKTKGALDLDVWFKQSKYYGDLKAHDASTSAIPGNDKRAIERAVREYPKFWYIVVTHTSVKDKEKDCTVSRFWNQKLSEKNGVEKSPTSYCGRMKYSVDLKELLVLEINRSNQKYLSDLTQGKNSDGSTRNLKIQIKKKDIDNFVVYRKDLQSE